MIIVIITINLYYTLRIHWDPILQVKVSNQPTANSPGKSAQLRFSLAICVGFIRWSSTWTRQTCTGFGGPVGLPARALGMMVMRLTKRPSVPYDGGDGARGYRGGVTFFESLMVPNLFHEIFPEICFFMLKNTKS